MWRLPTARLVGLAQVRAVARRTGLSLRGPVVLGYALIGPPPDGDNHIGVLM